MQVQDISRAYVRTVLHAVRLPLDAAQTVLHRGEQGSEWPPALAFDAFEASVKQVVGSFLRDDGLIEEGRLGQAKVDQLRRAVTLEAVADQERVQADDQYAQRLQHSDKRKADVGRQAETRRSAVEHRATEEKQAAQRRATEREQAEARIEKATDNAITRRERDAKTLRIHKERGALSEQRQALAIEDQASQIDRELAATKAARQARG